MRIYKSLPGNGITSRQNLRNSGMTRHQIDTALHTGDLIRIDRCRLATPDADTDAIAATRAGATLTCISALRKLGVATLPDTTMHLRQRRYCRRTRTLPQKTQLCNIPHHTTGPPIDTLETALEALIRNHDDETIIAALDSILHQRLRTRAELCPLMESISRRAQRLLQEADPRCESPLESLLRLRLKRRGIHLTPQVTIPGIGRVDFLVGQSLIIETDSITFHNDPEHFENDRRRDQTALAEGYRVLRITWKQLQHDWASVLWVIRDLIHRKAHLTPPTGATRTPQRQKTVARHNFWQGCCVGPEGVVDHGQAAFDPGGGRRSGSC